MTASSISKTYGKFTAVDDVSFVCRPGTVTGFLGPNGAGKTTTLRILVGLTPPPKDRHRWAGMRTRGYQVRHRRCCRTRPGFSVVNGVARFGLDSSGRFSSIYCCAIRYGFGNPDAESGRTALSARYLVMNRSGFEFPSPAPHPGSTPMSPVNQGAGGRMLGSGEVRCLRDGQACSQRIRTVEGQLC
jgi:energy-coupling factor transporter ATP-binding protein EcfA2